MVLQQWSLDAERYALSGMLLMMHSDGINGVSMWNFTLSLMALMMHSSGTLELGCGMLCYF
jgi:hypothetical protein